MARSFTSQDLIALPRLSAAEAVVLVTQLLTAADAAIRDYATRVAAHADPDEPGSEALSAALLEPLATWESRPVATGGGGGEGEGVPAEPAAPAGPGGPVRPGAGMPEPGAGLEAPEADPA
ncbi:uncharacterized protein SOCE26_064040 [Sorangium cellulosum]|uniref:Uncharacterized protein n=1 Tax=Sorangium cellulosum TaxID=56 RepID=A0A2L0F052_SORCE|nr:hypothetical protein [Sorangium cellulosum]AUX44934.1 uncharacterized protein SOCE26_064040 [Sorangium cellulosum]